VDIDAGDALVERIRPLARRTLGAGVLAGIGGFGALFELPRGYREPVLVAGTDGVGTKLRLAFALGRHDTVGVDLVAMSVNDILVQGAKPLFFLDYFACGRLDVDQAATVIGGIARACEQAGCALIGGETAEMPDSYPPGEYDLAGFALGVVEKAQIVDGSAVQPGDLILGLGSSGVHANGYSLVRKILTRRFGAISAQALGAPFPDDASTPAADSADARAQVDVPALALAQAPADASAIPDASSPAEAPVGQAGQGTLADALMAPTRIYVRSLLPLMQTGLIRAAAHITGGGIVGNLPRVLAVHLAAQIDDRAWPRPAIFAWLQEAGSVEDAEMYRVFNCGLGMLVVVAPGHAAEVLDRLQQAGESVHVVGKVVARTFGGPQVLIA